MLSSVMHDRLIVSHAELAVSVYYNLKPDKMKGVLVLRAFLVNNQ